MSPVTMAVRCPCGLELAGEDEAALVALVNQHLTQRHPRVAGAYDDEDILALSYRKAS